MSQNASRRLLASLLARPARAVQPSRQVRAPDAARFPPRPSATAAASAFCIATASPTLAASSRIAIPRASASVVPNLSASRSFSTSRAIYHGSLTRPEPGTGIKVTFRDSKGNDIKTVEVNEGDDLLSIAHEHDIDLEGACEGSIACSTCHVILDADVYDRLPEPGDDENDMLDLAFGLTDTSRLGCQVKVTRDLDGMVARLPAATRNMYVDGAKAGHH